MSRASWVPWIGINEITVSDAIARDNANHGTCLAGYSTLTHSL